MQKKITYNIYIYLYITISHILFRYDWSFFCSDEAQTIQNTNCGPRNGGPETVFVKFGSMSAANRPVAFKSWGLPWKFATLYYSCSISYNSKWFDSIESYFIILYWNPLKLIATITSSVLVWTHLKWIGTIWNHSKPLEILWARLNSFAIIWDVLKLFETFRH